MGRRTFWFTIVLAAALASPVISASAAATRPTAARGTQWLSAFPRAERRGSRPEKVLVTFRSGVDERESLASATRVSGDLRVRRSYWHLPVVAATLTADQIAKLGGDADIARVVPDAIVRLVPIGTKRAAVPTTLWAPVAVRKADPGVQPAQSTLGLDGDAANDGRLVYSKKDEVIAIVDSGVDGNQPDLDGGKILTFKDFVSNPSPDCPPPPDPVVPWDALGHGTLVASVAAGTGAAKPAMTGVAPGAALVVLKVFDCTGSAPESTIAAALDWLLSNRSTYGVDVVNMSFGFSAPGLDGNDLESQLTNQLAAAGVVPVVAAGNAGPGLDSVEAPGVARWALTAGSEKSNAAGNDLAEFSGRGPTADGRIKPDVLTPGVDIYGVEANSPTPQYVFDSGTSFSAPYLAGLAALALQANPALAPSGDACSAGGCADGVNDASMHAPLTDLAHAQATDWNVAGPDADTGWGALHAWPFLAAAAGATGAGPAYPTHFVRAGSVADRMESFVPIAVHAGVTVAVGLTVPTVDGFDGPYQGLLALDGRGAPVAATPDCASTQSGQTIFSACYPYGGGSRNNGIAWTPTRTETEFVGVRSLAGATTFVLDLSGARAAASDRMPVHISIPSEPIVPGGPPGTLSVRLGRRPKQTVHVELLGDGGLTFSKTALTFTPSSWKARQNVSAAAVARSQPLGNPHGSTLVAVASGATLDDSGTSSPRSVSVLDAPGVPFGPHTERVSLTDAGLQSWGPAYEAPSAPYVSTNGSVVAFDSRSTDLTGSDPNGVRADVFVRDRATQRTEKITPDSSGNDAELEGLSANGRLVLFSAYDSVVPHDTNRASDLFVKDRKTGTVTRVDVKANGAQMPRACSGCFDLPGAISGDGTRVAFVTDVPMTPGAPATGPEVYVRNEATGALTRVSVASDGSNGRPNVVETWAMTTALSSNGSVVLFSSASDGLAPGALPGRLNAYAHDMTTGTTTLVNADATGAALPLELGNPMVLSANGKFAAFETNGVPDAYSRIYVKNLETGSIELVNEPGAYDDSLTSISADGRTVAFWSGNPAYGGPGTVMRNLDTGVTTLICRQYSGNLFEVRTFARISSGANYAVWDSSFASFVPGDTNVATDTFLRRLS